MSFLGAAFPIGREKGRKPTAIAARTTNRAQKRPHYGRKVTKRSLNVGNERRARLIGGGRDLARDDGLNLGGFHLEMVPLRGVHRLGVGQHENAGHDG